MNFMIANFGSETPRKGVCSEIVQQLRSAVIKVDAIDISSHRAKRLPTLLQVM
jgi:hypothetical protein